MAWPVHHAELPKPCAREQAGSAFAGSLVEMAASCWVAGVAGEAAEESDGHGHAAAVGASADAVAPAPAAPAESSVAVG